MLPKDMRKRALTFAVVFPCAMAAIMFRAIMLPLGIIIVCIAIDEYHRTTRASVNVWSRGLNIVGTLFISFCAIFLSYQAFVFSYIFVIGFAFIYGMIRYSIGVNNVIEETFHRLCSDMFGQFYISFLWGHAFLLANKPYATPVLMYIILVTSMGEHGGFFAGSLFGSTRIVPHLSPNKSLEGFIGNLAASTIISYLLGFFWVGSLPFQLDHYWPLGLALGIFGIIGDLFESFIKRAFKKKDTADLLPGWGGVMDRIDGLLLNFALVFYIIELCYE